MRLVVSGGGTGGHVYPALAVIELLLDARSQNASLPTVTAANLLWIGSQGGMEEDLVRRAGLPYIGLPAGGLRGKGVLERIRNIVRIATSVGRARGILARFKAGVVFVTGGYACVSVTLAAWIQRVPVLIYLPDIVPGLAIRFLSRLATRVAVTSEESRQHLPPGKVVVTGYPVRYDVFALDRVQARRAMGLDEGEKTLLVFGGSRGAKSINRALVSGLPELLPICQIVHVSGRLDANWVADATEHLPDRLRAHYHHHAYLHDMPQALRAADLAVARAGAATLGELPAAGLPSILVPYPHSGQHQDPNADHMARDGASRVLADAHLADRLVPTIIELFGDDKELAKMRESAEAMAQPEAAQTIAQQLWLVGQHCAMAQLGAQS